jgi:hypothetical protein
MITCQRCNRPLHDPQSVRRGLGPVCYVKEFGADEAAGEPVLEPVTQPYSGEVVRVWRDGDPEAPGPCEASVPWSVIWHSPDGFNCGYGGSGPADLALNILNAFVPPGTDGHDPVRCHRGFASQTAADLHQAFKRDFIAGMDPAGGTIRADMIRDWIERNRIPDLLPV